MPWRWIVLPSDDQDLEHDIALLERWRAHVDPELLCCHLKWWTCFTPELVALLARSGVPAEARPALLQAADRIRMRRSAIETLDTRSTTKLSELVADQATISRKRGLRGVLANERARAEAIKAAADEQLARIGARRAQRARGVRAVSA